MLSSANLSDTYFTNRQDRYWWIKDNEKLSSYFNNLIQSISRFSFQVNGNGELNFVGPVSPIEDRSKFISYAIEQMENFFQASSKTSDIIQFNVELEQNNSSSSWVFPTIQMADLNIRDDEETTCQIFSNIIPNSYLSLFSPYLNLTSRYQELILSAKGKVDLLTASPKANCFFDAKDISKFIPLSYSVIEEALYHKIAQANKLDSIFIYEYEKSDWTFHAKGIWYYFPNQTLPSISLIGSANFGEKKIKKNSF